MTRHIRTRSLAAGVGVVVLGALAALPVAASAAPIPPQLRRANLKPILLAAPQVPARVKNLIRNYSGASGGIATPSISYGDLTGDDRAEVAVPIFSGGTAGDVAYYVLTVQNGRAKVIRAANDVYKVGVRIRAGKLVERIPIYAAADPNCCPSRVQTTILRWNGRALVVQSRRTVATGPN
jgi:hypothetical protein